MSRSINKVILLGFVGKEPEVRQVGDSAVANLSIATSEKFKDKAGLFTERTEWTNLVCWNNKYSKLADIVQGYVHKGSHLYVEGKLATRKWEKDGVTKYTTEVIVNELVLLDGKPDSAAEETPSW